jgi:hypothetical protein
MKINRPDMEIAVAEYAISSLDIIIIIYAVVFI